MRTTQRSAAMANDAAIVAEALTAYVEREIIPRYAAFDKAHREDHARMVIGQSMKLAAQMPELCADMVYAIAAFHDLGLAEGREHHHTASRRILEHDGFIASHFSPQQIELMGEAVEDHRASNGQRPRSVYGLVVAEADRCIDAETIIRRTVQYGLSHYPELDREGHFRRTMEHLKEKYGPRGYLKLWIAESDNARRLKLLQDMLEKPGLMREIFDRTFDEESGRSVVI